MGLFDKILSTGVTGNPVADALFTIIQDPNNVQYDALSKLGIAPTGGVDTSQPWWQGKSITGVARTPEEWQALDQQFKSEWEASQPAPEPYVQPTYTPSPVERMSLDKMRGTNQTSDYVQQRINQMPNITQMLSPTPQQPAAAPAQPKAQYEDVLNQIKQRYGYAQPSTGGIAAFAGGGIVKKGGRVMAEAMGKSAETIMRNKQIREEIKALKAQIQKNDDIARDVSMGAARGKARAANEALEPKLKALQDEFMELFQSGK